MTALEQALASAESTSMAALEAARDRAALGTGQFVVPTSGDSLGIAATSDGSRDAALLCRAPAQGPILFSGPFAMDTPERLAQTRRDSAASKMGAPDSVPFNKENPP